MLRKFWQALVGLDIYDKLFFVLAALQAGVIWLHRSFPTQDGPVQLYLADVFEDLIRGAGAYSSYFQMQGYAHPYSFSLYALMGFNQIFQPLTSERLLICLYFVAFALATRFLVRSVDAGNRWLPLFLLPFALNAYLCLGIYNFSYAVALLMFMMGLWLRWSGAWRAGRSLVWLALLMLMAWMHHVPLAILGIFIGVHLVSTAVHGLRSDGLAAALRRVRGDVAQVAMMAAPLGWYMVFAMSAVRGEAATIPVAEMSWTDRVRGLLQMLPISPYLGYGYCFCLLVIGLAPVVLFLTRPEGVTFAPRTAARACLALFATSMACLAVYVFGPHFLFGHGHGYFAERMAVPFVVCGLAALAPLHLPAVLQRVAVALVACVFLFMLAVEERQTAGMVAQLLPLYDAQPDRRGASAGAIVAGTEPLPGFNFNPYYWAPSLYAWKAKSILLNLSGSYEPIGLFGTKGAHPWDDSSPQKLRDLLADGKLSVSPPLVFVCGGKWDEVRAERDPPAALIGSRGMVRIFDSNVVYCYGKGKDAAPGQVQEAAR